MGYIHARVPDIEGVQDQPVKLVVRVDGVESNQWQITFEAKRVVQFLKAKDYIVTFCYPGFHRNSDICNRWATDNRAEWTIFRTEHYYSSMEMGHDIVVAGLKNG